MRVLLTTLNSKFIHSNLALRYLRDSLGSLPVKVIIDEFTINDNLEPVIGNIYRSKPDILAFSCYIWNIEKTLVIAKTLKRVRTDLIIILGGPEVSYGSSSIMEENPYIDYIVKGEGEITFPLLIDCIISEKHPNRIDGITYRLKGKIIDNREREPVKDLDIIPFPYEEGFDKLKNKIIYYETIRGCPFECQYCLSSLSRGVRYLPLDRVRRELKTFVDSGIPQVKLVDRTFNCNPERARKIFQTIIEMGGNTNFHFEICGDLLDEDTLDLLKSAPPGLLQFEIGVQSTYGKTLESIRRRTDFTRLSARVKELRDYKNIHLHLDLIAGLPKEDYHTFKESFNDVYRLSPDRLQLGFLKLLKGSGLRKNAQKWGYVFTPYTPYEVLENQDITYDEILKLKDIEDLVEKYYNSHRFENSLLYLGNIFGNDYFSLYEEFADYWRRMGLTGVSHSLFSLYKIIFQFGLGIKNIDQEYFKELIRLDYVSWQRPSSYPEGIEGEQGKDSKGKIRRFFNDPDNIARYLPDLIKYTPKQISRRAHIEFFAYDVTIDPTRGKRVKKPTQILFNYDTRGQIDSKAKITKLINLC